MIIKTDARNLLGGVSQQPSPVRRPDQCVEAVNTWPSAVDGRTKRQPTEHIEDILATVPTVVRWHVIDRDPTEQYLVVFEPANVRVYDLLAKTWRTVTDATASTFSYLSTMTGEDDLDVLSVADYTFVANRNAAVAMSSSTVTPGAGIGNDDAFFFVKQSGYLSDYTIKFRTNSTDYTFTCSTWDGGGTPGTSSIGPLPGAYGTGKIDGIRTTDISLDLYTQLVAAIAGTHATQPTLSNVAVSREGSVIRLKATSTNSFSYVTTEDSMAGALIGAIHRESPRVQGYLPETCYHGFKTKIVGDAEVEGDDYYVRFVVEDPTNKPFAEGHWEETVADGEEFTLDASTMPHGLVRTFAGAAPTFTWQALTWGDRTVGDAELVPDPSFVGLTIESMFYYKDRLCFISDQNVNMSETGEYFNFFRTTLLTLLDTAPIDVAVNHTRVAILKNAIPHDEDMLLFGARSQFVLRGSDILSPRTVQIVPVSEFENDTDIKPLDAARSLFFAFQRGDFSGIRELFQVGSVDRFDAVDITAEVPKYLPGRIEQLIGTTLEDAVLVRTDEEPDRIYVYKYLWSGQDKVLSSWGHWEFSGDVLHMHFVENTLYLVMKRGSLVFLETMEIATGLSDPGSRFTTMLDRRFDQDDAVSSTFDSVTGITTVEAPYTIVSGDFRMVNKDTLIAYQCELNPDGDLEIRGDVTAEDWWCGETYEMRYRFSPPLVKAESRGGYLGEQIPSQTVLHGFLQFDISRVFNVDVRVGNRSASRYSFNGWSPSIGDYVEQIPVYFTGSTIVASLGTRFDAYRFEEGTWISIEGTASNDGIYRIASAAATALTVEETFVVEGNQSSPVLATITKGPLIGSVSLLSGEFQYAVQGPAKDTDIVVINDSPYPSNLVAASWNIRYRPRARRLRG